MKKVEFNEHDFIISKQAITDMKKDLETKMNEQIANMTNGQYNEDFLPMRMDYFQNRMRALNKILAAFETGASCLNTLYLHCKDEVENFYNEVKNGGDLRLAEGIITLYNMVEKYGIEEGYEEYPLDALTPCKTYHHAILDGRYIDKVLASLKDCRAELVEQVEMLEDENLEVDGLMEEHGMQGYLNSCNILIKGIEQRKQDDLLEHEKELECFYVAMQNMFPNNEDILEACKFAVKIFMRENQVSRILTNCTSYFIRDLQSKEDIVECIEETASKIKDSILDDWYVENDDDLREKKRELDGLFIVLDYLKALLY